MRTIKAISGAAVILGFLWVLAALPARIPAPPAAPESVSGIPIPVAYYIQTLRPGHVSRSGAERESVIPVEAGPGRSLRIDSDQVEQAARVPASSEAGE